VFLGLALAGFMVASFESLRGIRTTTGTFYVVWFPFFVVFMKQEVNIPIDFIVNFLY